MILVYVLPVLDSSEQSSGKLHLQCAAAPDPHWR